MMGEGERGSICSGISTRLVSSHFGSEMWSHRVGEKSTAGSSRELGGRKGAKWTRRREMGKEKNASRLSFH